MIYDGTRLADVFKAAAALGEIAISSDAMLVIDGYEALSGLIKQFPFPVLSAGEGVEIVMPHGGMRREPSAPNTAQQGPVTINETVLGTATLFLEKIIKSGGKFNATVYEGSPENFTRKARIFGAYINAENPDRNFEDRTQCVAITGTMFFNYFGTEE